MKHYVDNMIKAYEYASNTGLIVVVCITYWYDEKHLAELRRLIKNGCDEVAVMNYYHSINLLMPLIALDGVNVDDCSFHHKTKTYKNPVLIQGF